MLDLVAGSRFTSSVRDVVQVAAGLVEVIEQLAEVIVRMIII